MKYYHVIIEKNHPFWTGTEELEKMKNTRREIICKGKAYAPEGWHIVGVCGYHEKPTEE
jgi:hypothetical protein